MSQHKSYSRLFLFFLLAIFAVQCSKDKSDEIPENLVPTGKSKVYQLYAANDSDISGTITFVENEGDFLTANVNLENTISGGRHPVFLHRFTIAEGGGKALSLGTVDGNNGTLSTTFFKLNDNSKFGFEELLQFDGYINIVLSESDQSTDLASGDVGINELNGNSMVYDLENETEGVIGTVSFNERVNGTCLVILGLENNPEAGNYPCHIHMGDATTGGSIAISLQSVDGSEGFGLSQVNALDNGTLITYEELLTFEGYIDIHESTSGNVRATAIIDSN